MLRDSNLLSALLGLPVEAAAVPRHEGAVEPAGSNGRRHVGSSETWPPLNRLSSSYRPKVATEATAADGTALRCDVTATWS